MAIDLSVVFEGIGHAFSLLNLLWLVIGVTLGLIAGTLPGFSGGSMMAVLLPVVTTLPVDTMLIALAAIYAANVYSDSTTGILYNIPGGAAGVPATVEGYKLKQKGELIEAFAAQVSASFFGATFGFFFLILLVPTFLYFVRFFGSGERALLAVWALVFISSGVITRGDPLRAFLSVGVGLTLGLIGQQPNIGTFRFTFGIPGMWDGLAVVLVALSLFAIPQCLEMIRGRDEFSKESGQNKAIPIKALYSRIFGLLWEGRSILTRASLFGVLMGVIPGVGTSTAAWGGYSLAQRNTKRPQPFGTGNPDGVLGAESASNANEVGHIIPLLALGIPGSSGAAIMLGALTMVGINPGPSMYANYGPQVWTIIFGIGLSAFVFTFLGYPFIIAAQRMSKLSVPMLVAAIGVLCVMGAYLESFSNFGPIMMLFVGVLTLLGTHIGLRPPAVLIGFVLGPGIEKELVRGYQIGGFERFLHPASVLIIVVILVTLVLGIRRAFQERKAARLAAAAGTVEVDLSVDVEHFGEVKSVLLGALGILLAGAMIITSLSYPFFAAIWVFFVAIFFLIFPSAMLLVRNMAGFPAAFGVTRATPWSQLIPKDTLLIEGRVVVLFLAYILLMPILGFIPSSALFTLALMLSFEKGVLRGILSALGVGFFIWAVTFGFEIYMPRGIFHLPF